MARRASDRESESERGSVTEDGLSPSPGGSQVTDRDRPRSDRTVSIGGALATGIQDLG